MRRSVTTMSTVAATLVLSMALATPAHAQLGKLRKIAGDAVKDAAKDKAGIKDPESSQSGGGAKVDYTITDERVTAIVASLAPYVETAKRKAAEAAAEKAVKAEKESRDAKAKIVSECLTKAASAGGLPDMGWSQTPKGEALMAKLQSVSGRIGSPQVQKSGRLQAALMDTITVLQSQQMAMMYPKSTCGTFPYASKALLEYNGAQLDRAMTATADKEMERGEGELVVAPEQRGKMTTGQFGRIREAIAIWLLQQSGDLPPNAYKFTDAEKAVLTGKAPQLKDLGPLFKTNALTWASWGDIKAW